MTNEVSASKPGPKSTLTDDMRDRAEQYIYAYEEQGDVIPSAAGLACWLGIANSTLYLRKKDCPRISDALDAIQVKQETVALNRGITGDFNATITKLVLANHGYSDKQEVAHTSPDGSMTPAPTTIRIVAADDRSDA